MGSTFSESSAELSFHWNLLPALWKESGDSSERSAVGSHSFGRLCLLYDLEVGDSRSDLGPFPLPSDMKEEEGSAIQILPAVTNDFLFHILC